MKSTRVHAARNKLECGLQLGCCDHHNLMEIDPKRHNLMERDPKRQRKVIEIL
jgi:hypothetical protein